MKVTVVAKNIELTNALKEIVEKKIRKLEKYFEGDINARATLSVQKSRHTIEVTIPFNGVILRGEESTDDMYKSLDLVIDKLERQIRKNKTRIMSKQGKTSHDFDMSVIETEKETEEKKIVKRKSVEVKPMDEEEAILQMELLGHQFYMYKDSNTNKTAVVYQRNDGNYGVIESE